MNGRTDPAHHQHHAPEPERASGHDHATKMADSGMVREMERDMRRRFWVALAFTVPVTLLAGHIPGLPMFLHPPLAGWVELALSIPVAWRAGWIFIRGSYQALRSRELDMSVLIATGVLAAWLASLYPTAIVHSPKLRALGIRPQRQAMARAWLSKLVKLAPPMHHSGPASLKR